ncbi:MAG: carboxypeptidase regulatory-like domain-containing protein [Rhodanobacteraceae bacterium]|jgi:hypothetical protein|nr:carboxypeptidase regulatory-like domain-containing protein [Rhodanobacteraceae bacterium]
MIGRALRPAGIGLVFLLLAAARPAAAVAFPDTVFANAFEPCSGLECAQVACPGGRTTAVSGTVYMPNGTLPLPNVEVYVPNAPVGALPPSPQHLRCEQAPAGDPLVATLSGADGRFTLYNVPIGANVPLVLLAGKWRRQVTIPNVAACTETPLNASLTRLPRNAGEGDLPRIAIATGAADSLECLLRKSGVDDSEFGISGGNQRIHMFKATGVGQFDAAHGGAVFPAATTLWSSDVALSNYDQVLLACEGGQNESTKPMAARNALRTYLYGGGRVYLGHFQNFWLQAGPAPLNILGTWNLALPPLGALTVDVDVGSAQGAMFSAWLSVSEATTTANTLDLLDARQTLISTNEALARTRLYKTLTANGLPSVQYFSAATPIGAPPSDQQGRLAFADTHPGSGDSSSAGSGFPSGGCLSPQTSLTPQDKALLYAVFDLERCLDSDGD